MKRFLLDLLGFCSGLLVCIACVCVFNALTVSLNAPEVDSSILIAGDSHTRNALDPAVLGSATNISQYAEPYYVSYWKLKRLLRGSSVQTVILGFAHHNISAFNDRKLSDETWSTELFRRVYMFGEVCSIKGIRVDRSELLSARIKNLALTPKWRHDNYMGRFETWNRTDLADPDSAITRHFLRDGPNLSEVERTYLDSIIDLSARENVELILISTPVHATYLRRVPDYFLSQFEAKIDELEARGIQVLDFTCLGAADDEFLNASHLNAKGASRFSQLISEHIRDSSGEATAVHSCFPEDRRGDRVQSPEIGR
jgi:hypothetical protein